jgi:anti-sigma regulatory factor (Ser/Thr protein kinase)
VAETLTIPAELAQLAHVRSWIVERLADAGVQAPARVDIELVVTEAVANVVRHTFRGRDGSIEVSVAVADGVVQLVIIDDGPPWDGTRATPADDGRGGYGVPLIEEVMDRVEHRALEPAGNRLTLEKRVES